MQQLLEKYKDIIRSDSIQKYEISGTNIKLRMTIVFVDDSCLFIKETIISGVKRKYAYHWQNKNNQLIKRWDNAPDWDVDTFPHHLHIGDKEVVSSYDRSIEKILEIINKEIKA